MSEALENYSALPEKPAMVLVPSGLLQAGAEDALASETDKLVRVQSLNYLGLTLINSALLKSPDVSQASLPE